MGEGSRSPQFYPCHHLSQRAGQVHGGREQVTTVVPLSPLSTEVWASSWGREVGHHIFYLVTIWHRGLGQLMGKGSRSPQFYPCHHLTHRSGPVHGEKEQLTKILPLSPFSTEGWASSWGREQVTNILPLSPFGREGQASSWEKGGGHHIFTLVTIQHSGLGQFMGEGSWSPQLYPCHHLAHRSGPVHGGREQVTTFLPLSSFSTEGQASSWGNRVYLVTIQDRGRGQFTEEGSRSPHFKTCHP